MSSTQGWYRCRGCRRTFKTEQRLHQHIAHSDKCRAREERYLETLASQPHLENTTPSAVLRSHPPPTRASGPTKPIGDHLVHITATPDDNGSDTQPSDLEDQLAAETEVQDKNDVRSPSPQLLFGAPRSVPRKTHGYATVETHPNAARVFEWVKPRQTFPSDNPLNQPELFRTGEWLCQLPISHEDRMLYFDIQRHKRDTPWENVTQLYKSVDALPHGPGWTHKYMTVTTPQGVETLDLWRRDSLEIVRELIGDPRFAKRMRYAPEMHYRITPDGRRVKVRGEAWTGDWWWRTQDMLGGDATIASIVLATDATQLSLICGSNKVWPVYMGITNISKAVRRCPSERAMILVGYIPVPDLSFITNAEERGRKKWEIYHASMQAILEPLKKASSKGVKMVCADGGVRHVHPIVAAHMADFEEQCLASCTQKTRCPICDVKMHDRGDDLGGAKIRTRLQTLQALAHERRGYTMTRQNLGLRPVRPYWASLPFATGHTSFVPDILHQIYQGVFKDHLFSRWRHILNEVTVDNRLMGMPRFPGIRHFKNGISKFFKSQFTGTESRAAAKVCLPMVAGSKPAEAVGATRCITDFMYRAHLPQLDDDDLEAMESDLAEFHQLKQVFVSHGGLTSEHGWNGIPKIHMLSHYVFLIREYGTIDGYSTDISERLHIDRVKTFYRASNKVDPIEQMVTSLQRQDAWVMQRRKLEELGLIPKLKKRSQRSDEGSEDVEKNKAEVEEDEEEAAEGIAGWDDETIEQVDEDQDQVVAATTNDKQCHPTEYHPDPILCYAKSPSKPSVTGRDIALQHQAPSFLKAVQDYVSQLPGAAEDARLLGDHLRFGVWTKVSLVHDRLPFAPLVGRKTDLIRARPVRPSERLIRQRTSTYDTALVEVDPSAHGIHRTFSSPVHNYFMMLIEHLVRILRCASARHLPTANFLSQTYIRTIGLR
ncbi:hypothetical protein FRC12_007131 [Ceratobasidium sp. 428]|nr:hypothetical protein FRC12_007131 [Ceratobasidium sp. 428]